jgi:hypothetical protein
MGITQWEARQNWDDYLAWRTVHGFTATFDEMLVQPMMIRYWGRDPIPAVTVKKAPGTGALLAEGDAPIFGSTGG